MRLAVIPARGGSKRIPRKNIKPFCGKPIIAWSIEAARQSGCFDRIIVSTDDREIADVAQAHGAEVPFLRPPELSDDFATTAVVIKHAVEWQNNTGEAAEAVCCLYATAPFIQPSALRGALSTLLEERCNYVFSATSYAFPIARAFRLVDDHRVEMFDAAQRNTRSQDLDEAYHDAGQFYWGIGAAWLEGQPIFSRQSVARVLPRFRVQDIDTPEDWERAEWMFRQMNSPEFQKKEDAQDAC